jgi:hypothetical protein
MPDWRHATEGTSEVYFVVMFEILFSPFPELGLQNSFSFLGGGNAITLFPEVVWSVMRIRLLGLGMVEGFGLLGIR